MAPERVDGMTLASHVSPARSLHTLKINIDVFHSNTSTKLSVFLVTSLLFPRC